LLPGISWSLGAHRADPGVPSFDQDDPRMRRPDGPRRRLFDIASLQGPARGDAPIVRLKPGEPLRARLPLPRGIDASDHVRGPDAERVTDQKQGGHRRRLQAPFEVADVRA